MTNSVSVSQLNRYVKFLLDSDEKIKNIWVEGEISNYVLNQTSGHAYFSLKDSEASIKCVLFKGSSYKVKFIPENGMKVLVYCSVSLYERDGAFQVIVSDMVPKGAGELNANFEKLKQKLLSEGFFEQSQKRPIMKYPKKIAVITSGSGAAFKDIVSVIERRYPIVELLLIPASVQGVFAEQSILDAIDTVNKMKDIDTVIIARGGGSKEDLFVFNSEKIVRKAATLRASFISAVGHEIDYTLLDYASDLRVPTPSAAAEVAVPDINVILQTIKGYNILNSNNINKKIDSSLDSFKPILKNISRSVERKTALSIAKVDYFVEKNKDRIERVFQNKIDAVVYVNSRINDLGPLKTLNRGFAAVSKDGVRIKSVGQVKVSDKIDVSLGDGNLSCSVDEVKVGKVED